MHRKQWIFDMDGTLTDSMDLVWRSVPIALLEYYGIQPRPGLHETLLSMTMREGSAYIQREYALHVSDAEFMVALREIVPHLYQKVELKPGVRELIAHLNAEKAALCICSNTWADQCRTVLGRLGIADSFSFYIMAQGAQSKSHPEVFFEALHRLGGTDPSHCVVCEDSLYAAQTAHAAGFYVIGIADAASRADEPALRQVCDQFLEDWTQLDWEKL